MALDFPNSSRSFDAARNAVRFTGYDGMFEIAFFVETDALARTARGAKPASEAEWLAAFDAARNTVLEAARRAYSGRNRPAYILTAAQFR
jgi:hypothetical protein